MNTKKYYVLIQMLVDFNIYSAGTVRHYMKNSLIFGSNLKSTI